MKLPKYLRLSAKMLFCVGFLITLINLKLQAQTAESEKGNPEALKGLFDKPLQWTSSGILVSPVSDESHTIVSVKDPTIVRFNDLWHIYATVFSTSANTWNMVYLNFKDWIDAPKAKLTFVDSNPNLTGYHCAPHVFYFRPHKKWYLIFQSQQPQYCTTDDLSKPETWTKPQDFFETTWDGGNVFIISWPPGRVYERPGYPARSVHQDTPDSCNPVKNSRSRKRTKQDPA